MRTAPVNKSRPPTPRLRSIALTSTVAILAACAIAPLKIDTAARAPKLDGFGASTLTITTRSPDARQLFAQGMEQAYAFNEAEAVRAFKAALAQDADCAMCAWGVAYQLGPNINATERGDLREALSYADYAVKHAEGTTPMEHALIAALASRYGHASEARSTAVLAAPRCSTGGGGGNQPDPLDVVYAARMRELADRYAGDPDIVSMYAEAEMIATRDDWWDADTGAPGGRMGEVALRLETALKQHPDHVGLNHYLIHAVDAQPVAARAEAAADRLGALAPKSPHLVHMPSHTYAQLGRFADATRVNQQAVALDVTMSEELKAQGFADTKDWRGHNGHFLWYAAVMQGRGDVALDAARASAAMVEKSKSEFGEFIRARPVLTLLRMERWAAVLQEPLPAGDKGMATVLGQYARGVAYARTGQPERAAEALALLDPVATRLIEAHPKDDYIDGLFRSLLLVARESLRAELAMSQGQPDAALAFQAQAVSVARDLDQAEPPTLAAGTRIALGDLQLRTQHWADAEQTFRADLAMHPHSGWALRGLMQALQAQGRGAEAATLRSDLGQQWRLADAGLLPKS